MLSRELARKAVLEASRFDPPPPVAFTAGEPFVVLEARHALVALAHSHGVAREVVI